nr:HAMP domain-containing sensor histidine kinase [Endozoicomonas sp. OPT23]
MLQRHQTALKAIASLPDIEKLLRKDTHLSASTLNLIYFDIDRPEIYGALFFNHQWQLKKALPGQSASGSPYWKGDSFSIDHLPKTQISNGWLIGPQTPVRGKSGWYLIARQIDDVEQGGESPGYIAFQVRLASLTKALATLDSDQGYGCLNIVSSICFDVLGQLNDSTEPPVSTTDFLAHWQIQLNSKTTDTASNLTTQRGLYLAVAIITLLLVSLFFTALVARTRHRIKPLIHGAEAIADGDWNHVIPSSGNDEVTQLTSSLNRMAEQLKNLMAVRIQMEKKATQGDFATGVAHEIRNPLATIKICLQSLPLSSNNPQATELKQLMLEEIDRINQLIQNLLDYSKPLRPSTDLIDSSALLQRIINLVGPMAKEQSIALTLEIEDQIQFKADTEQLHQVIMNLILNAIEAIESHKDGQIHIHCYQKSGKAVITVTDNGPGISLTDQKKVMEPFFTTKTSGTGLGLAISARLVELNGGQLSLSSSAASQSGSGTTATLTFDV